VLWFVGLMLAVDGRLSWWRCWSDGGKVSGGVIGLFFIRFCGIIVHAVITGFASHGIAVREGWRCRALAAVLHVGYDLFFPSFYMMQE